MKVHDLIDPAIGKANPTASTTSPTSSAVSVGADYDTAAFAVETIRRWWEQVGQPLHPGAARLLLCADGGGSNGYRTRLWKTELANLATQTGLIISTVAHLPPGTSKWNKIEHRLCSHISMNWRDRPPTSHEIIVQITAATTTTAGLSVQAELDDSLYPNGIKITDQDMQTLEAARTLTRSDFHSEWNDTLDPHHRDTPDTNQVN